MRHVGQAGQGSRAPLQRPAHPIDPSPRPFPPLPHHSCCKDFPLLMVSEQQLTVEAGLCKACSSLPVSCCLQRAPLCLVLNQPG